MDHALDYANEFLAATYGVDGAALLAPIDPAQPQGEALRGTPAWQAIRRARESDDASLPLGAWVRQLKRAAWNEVADATLDALLSRTKDLQLSIWLAEALLHEYGFAGLAASVAIIDALCERYWDALYPTIAGGDLEHRANLFRWLNEKLIAPVRLVPLTSSADGEGARAYTWADCEQLRRQQQLAYAGGERNDAGGAEGIDAADFAKALAATSDDALAGTHAALGHAIGALARLTATLDRCFDGDAPGVGMLRGQLEQIQGFIAAELMQRGVSIEKGGRGCGSVAAGAGGSAEWAAPAVPLESAGAAATAAASLAAEIAAADEPAARASAESLPLPASLPNSRKRAYAQLADAAAALAEIEPHSPVPYLIRKAVEWGALNTAQLYDELFIQGRGQLNVFELLGLGLPQAADDAS